MDLSKIQHLLRHWPIEPAVALDALAGGTNNQVWLVKTADGSSYVLRLAASPDAVDLGRFGYETALLGALRDASLPFSLPLPLQARAGEPFILVEQDNEMPAIATLTPFLHGTVPERTAPNIAEAGKALAQLDRVLATIPRDALPTDEGPTHFQYGSLSDCHPLVPDPFAVMERILEPDQARLLCQILRRAQEDWEMLSDRALPQQILHRDCGPGNVLMDHDHVTAILDFEFAGMDRRVFDLCVAISWWPVRVMGTGQEWELIDAFGKAYANALPLIEEELRALPAALRLRDITSLIYRIGRLLAGLENKKTIQERVNHSLWREAWLIANSETLVEHAMTWGTATHALHATKHSFPQA